MGQGISYINAFLSYLLLMIIIICVAAFGFAIGRILRKRKDSKSAVSESVEQVSAASPGSSDNS